MPRVRSGAARHRKQKKILKAARGYRGGKSKLYRTAKEALMRAGRFGFFGRRQKKRDYRALWITRISAALMDKGINYSRFINGLKKANVLTNRKAISELAIHDTKAFDELVRMARQHAKAN